MRTLVKALPAHNISLQINHDGGESYPAHIYGYWAAHNLCTYMLTIQPSLDLEGAVLLCQCTGPAPRYKEWSGCTVVTQTSPARGYGGAL